MIHIMQVLKRVIKHICLTCDSYFMVKADLDLLTHTDKIVALYYLFSLHCYQKPSCRLIRYKQGIQFQILFIEGQQN